MSESHLAGRLPTLSTGAESAYSSSTTAASEGAPLRNSKFEDFELAFRIYRPNLAAPPHEPSMNAPVPPKTVGAVAYVFLSLLLICAVAIMMTADASSGLVQSVVIPLRADVKPVSCEPQPENDGHLVHIDCPIRRMHTFNVAPDFAANLPAFRGVFFEMRVEMFQHSLVPGLLRSSLGGVWSESLIPTQAGWAFWSNAKNPDYFPHVPGSGRHFGSTLYGGGFRLERPHLIDFHGKKQLNLYDDRAYIPSLERPPVRLSSTNTRLYRNYLYSGDPLKPAVGDLRVSFYGSMATHLSAIGIQSHGLAWSSERAMKGFQDPFSRVSSAIHATHHSQQQNRTRTLVLEGDYTASALLDVFASDNDIPSRYLWLTRALGFLTAWTWAFFTYQIIRRETGANYGVGGTMLAAATVGLSICFSLIGLTKLTYSVFACIACLLVSLFLFILSHTCRCQVSRKSGATGSYTALPVVAGPGPLLDLEAPPPVNPGSHGGSAQTSSYVAL